MGELDAYVVATVADFATIMRDLRMRKGWTQTDLATQVGKTRRWVSSVERGKTDLSLSSALAVMRVLGYGASFQKHIRSGEIDLIAMVLGE